MNEAGKLSRTSRRTWIGRLAGMWIVALPQQPEPEPAGRKMLTLTARKFQFDPEVIDVRRNDIVRITITAPMPTPTKGSDTNSPMPPSTSNLVSGSMSPSRIMGQFEFPVFRPGVDTIRPCRRQ